MEKTKQFGVRLPEETVDIIRNYQNVYKNGVQMHSQAHFLKTAIEHFLKARSVTVLK